jgi:hypothetical protein
MANARELPLVLASDSRPRATPLDLRVRPVLVRPAAETGERHFQTRPLVVGEPQRRGQGSKRMRVGPPPLPFFECADRGNAYAGAFGKQLLR